MRVVVAGSNEAALFVIGSFIEAGHKVVSICDDRKRAEIISRAYGITVINGNPTKRYVLDEAGLERCDLIIALMDDDADNLVVCQSAQRLYGVHKRVCTVGNPRNVEVFAKLGVPIAISAAYRLAQSIEQASVRDDVTLEEALDDYAL